MKLLFDIELPPWGGLGGIFIGYTSFRGTETERIYLVTLLFNRIGFTTRFSSVKSLIRNFEVDGVFNCINGDNISILTNAIPPPSYASR
jgi:hypothetical protein